MKVLLAIDGEPKEAIIGEAKQWGADLAWAGATRPGRSRAPLHGPARCSVRVPGGPPVSPCRPANLRWCATPYRSPRQSLTWRPAGGPASGPPAPRPSTDAGASA